jgi:hypothetical protein
MTPPYDSWRVSVTPGDVRAATRALRAARAGGASPETLVELGDDLLRLRRAALVQLPAWRVNPARRLRVTAGPGDAEPVHPRVRRLHRAAPACDAAPGEAR